MKEINGIKLYTLQEIAKTLNITIITLRKYINTKKIFAIRIGRRYWIPEEALIKFLQPDFDTTKGARSEKKKN